MIVHTLLLAIVCAATAGLIIGDKIDLTHYNELYRMWDILHWQKGGFDFTNHETDILGDGF